MKNEDNVSYRFPNLFYKKLKFLMDSGVRTEIIFLSDVSSKIGFYELLNLSELNFDTNAQIDAFEAEVDYYGQVLRLNSKKINQDLIRYFVESEDSNSVCKYYSAEEEEFHLIDNGFAIPPKNHLMKLYEIIPKKFSKRIYVRKEEEERRVVHVGVEGKIENISKILLHLYLILKSVNYDLKTVGISDLDGNDLFIMMIANKNNEYLCYIGLISRQDIYTMKLNNDFVVLDNEDIKNHKYSSNSIEKFISNEYIKYKKDFIENDDKEVVNSFESDFKSYDGYDDEWGYYNIHGEFPKWMK